MPIKTTCPSCGLTCSAPDHLHGKTIKCKRCTTAFAIGSQAQLHEDSPAAAAPLIPPPKGGLPLRPAPHAHRYKQELYGAAIVAVITPILLLVFWLVYRWLKP
jgi:hypothetical protein